MWAVRVCKSSKFLEHSTSNKSPHDSTQGNPHPPNMGTRDESRVESVEKQRHNPRARFDTRLWMMTLCRRWHCCWQTCVPPVAWCEVTGSFGTRSSSFVVWCSAGVSLGSKRGWCLPSGRRSHTNPREFTCKFRSVGRESELFTMHPRGPTCVPFAPNCHCLCPVQKETKIKRQWLRSLGGKNNYLATKKKHTSNCTLRRSNVTSSDKKKNSNYWWPKWSHKLAQGTRFANNLNQSFEFR